MLDFQKDLTHDDWLRLSNFMYMKTEAEIQEFTKFVTNLKNESITSVYLFLCMSRYVFELTSSSKQIGGITRLRSHGFSVSSSGADQR